MSLAETGNARRARAPKGGKAKGANKTDAVLSVLDDEDRDTLLAWLRDPEWSNYMIAESMASYTRARNDGGDYTLSHPTIKAWRQREGIIE